MLDENALELRAYEICAKWDSRIGGGFHPDTRGKDYTPEMSVEEISAYDRDMDKLFRIAGDPEQSHRGFTKPTLRQRQPG
jgi:hypothetical protein